MKNRGQWLRALLIAAVVNSRIRSHRLPTESAIPIQALSVGILIELIKGNNRWIGPTKIEFPTNIDDGGRELTGNIQGSGYPVGSGNTPDQWQNPGSEGTGPYNSWGPSDSQIKSNEDTNYQSDKVREDGLGLKDIKSTDQSFATNNQQDKNGGWSVVDVQDKEYDNQKVEPANTPYEGTFTDLRTINNVIPEDTKKPNEFVGQEIIVTGWKPLQDGITLTAHEITNSDWNKLQENGMTSPEITISNWNHQNPEGVQTSSEKSGQTGRDWQPDQNQQHDEAIWRSEGNKNNNGQWGNTGPSQQSDANVWVDKSVQENIDVWNADDKRQSDFNNENPAQNWNPRGNAQTAEGGWNTQENANNWNSYDQQQEHFQNKHYGPMNEGKHEGKLPNAGNGWETANKIPNDMAWSHENSLRQKEESWKQGNDKQHSFNEQNRQQTDNTWLNNPAQPEYINNRQFSDVQHNPGGNQPNNGGSHAHEGNGNSNEGTINNDNYGSEGFIPSNTWRGSENSDGGISNFQPPEEKHIGTNYGTTDGDIPENFPGAAFPPTENAYGNQGVADNLGKPIEGTTDADLAKGDIGNTAPDFAIRQPQGNYKGSDGSYHTNDNYGETSHENTIPGTAGQDYPNFLAIPTTAFDCKKQEYPGYFADIETGCQVYHVCQTDGRHDSFLCPAGTIFNQKLFTCTWWYNYDCSSSTEHYSLNLMLYREGDAQGNFKGSHYPGGRVNGAQVFPQSGLAPASNAPHQNEGSRYGGQVAFGNEAVSNVAVGAPFGDYDNHNENTQVNDFPLGQNEQNYGIQVGGEDGTRRDYNYLSQEDRPDFRSDHNTGGGRDYNSLSKEDRPDFGSDHKTGGGRDYNSYNDGGNQNFGIDHSNERGANIGNYSPLTTNDRQKLGTNTNNWEQRHLSNEEWNNADNYDSGNAGSRWGSETQNDKNIGNTAKWDDSHHNAGLWTPEEIHATGGGSANEYPKNVNDDSSYKMRDETGVWEGANRQNWDSHSRFPGESNINEQNTVFVDKNGDVLPNENNRATKVPEWNKIKGSTGANIDNRNSQWFGVINKEPMLRQNIHNENVGRNYNEGKYVTISNVRENTDVSPRKGFEQGISHVYGSSWNPQNIYNSGIRRVWEDTDVRRAGELGDKTVNNAEERSKGKKENLNIIEGNNQRTGDKKGVPVDVKDPEPNIDVVTEDGTFIREDRNYGKSTGEGGDIQGQYKIREDGRDSRITHEMDEKYVIPMRLIVPDARKEKEIATVKGVEEVLPRGINKYAMPMEAVRILPEIYGFRDSNIELRMNAHVDKNNGKYIIPVIEQIRKDDETFKSDNDSPIDLNRSTGRVEGSFPRQESAAIEIENRSQDDTRYNLPSREENRNKEHGQTEYNGNRQGRSHSTTENNWRSKYNHEEPRDQYQQESSERHYVSMRPEITKHMYHRHKGITKSIGKDQLRDKTEGEMSEIYSPTGTIQISKSTVTRKSEIIAESEISSKDNPKLTNSSAKGNLDNAKKHKTKNSKINSSYETKISNSHANRNNSFTINDKMTEDIGPYNVPNLESSAKNGAKANYNDRRTIDITSTDLGKNTSPRDSTLPESRKNARSKKYKIIARNRFQGPMNRPNQDRKDRSENDYRPNSKTTSLSTSFS